MPERSTEMPNLAFQECFTAERLDKLCNECPIAPLRPETDPSDCLQRRLGRLLVKEGQRREETETELAEVRGKNARLEATNQELERDLAITKWDPLLTGFLTPGGLEVELRTNKTLQSELKTRRCGVLRMDLRGLSLVNDVSHALGNAFLQVMAHRMRTAVRGGAADGYSGTERRVGDSAERDILYFRAGGDEGGLIMRSVSPLDFIIVTERLRDNFSIDRALKHGDAIPLMSSVGGVHATAYEPFNLETADDVRNYVMRLNNIADKRERQQKSVQYGRMWKDLILRDPSLATTYPPRPDTRTIAKLFFETYFPEFARDPEKIVQSAVTGMEAETLKLKR